MSAAQLAQIKQEQAVFKSAYESGQITKEQYTQAMVYSQQKYNELVSQRQQQTASTVTTPPTSAAAYVAGNWQEPAPQPTRPPMTSLEVTHPPQTKAEAEAQAFYQMVGQPQLALKYPAPTIAPDQRVVSVTEKTTEKGETVVEVVTAPKEQAQPGLGAVGLLAVQTFENIVLAKTGQQENELARSFLQLGPLSQAYMAVGGVTALEENVYSVPRLLGVKTPYTEPTHTGSAISAVFGDYSAEQRLQELPYSYRFGTFLGEAAFTVVTSEALDRATSYIYRKSGLASKTQQYINKRYLESMEQAGKWKPTKTDKLLMKITGVKPDLARSIVDVPEQVLPASRTAAVKEYPTFAQKYYIKTGEAMPKDFLKGFKFEGTADDIAQLAKVTPKGKAMPEDFLQGFKATSNVKNYLDEAKEIVKTGAYKKAEAMPVNWLSSYSAKEMSYIQKVSKPVTAPSLKVLEAQSVAWDIAIQPKSSALLIGKYVEPARPFSVAMGKWSSYALGTSATQLTKTVEKTTTKPFTPTPSTAKVVTKTITVPVITPPTVPAPALTQTQKQQVNPFLQYAGKPFYQQRSRVAEETETVFPVLPGQPLKPQTPQTLQRTLTRTPKSAPQIETGLSALLETAPKAAQLPQQRAVVAQTPKQRTVLTQETTTVTSPPVVSSVLPKTARNFNAALRNLGSGGGGRRGGGFDVGRWYKKRHPVATIEQNIRFAVGGKLKKKTKRKKSKRKKRRSRR